MNALELDQEIKDIHKAINELTEKKQFGAIKLAEADLSYYISLLKN